MLRRGALEDGQSSEPQSNLEDPEWVDEGMVPPPVPLTGDTCHTGNIPMPPRGAPEDGPGFEPQANLDDPACSQLTARPARIATAQ